jgi:hypothetical protein
MQFYTLAAVIYVAGWAWYWQDGSYYIFDSTRRIDGELVLYRRIKRDSPGNRTPIPRDEFFVKGPTESEIDAFFHFDAPLYDVASQRLDPLWTCFPEFLSTGTLDRNLHDHETYPTGERKRKLVFLHMSRTGGSTIRGLLKAYGAKCRVNVAAVSRCVDLNLRTMKYADIWRNGRDSYASGQSCFLTHVSNRTDDTKLRTKGKSLTDVSVSSARLQAMQIDVLMGRLSIGSDEYWYTTDTRGNQKPASAQYVAFLRDPLERYVSDIMSQTPHSGTLSIKEAVAAVFAAALDTSKRGRYLVHYSNYLISPQQKAWVEDHSVFWTPERRVNLTLRNLASQNVIVGLVERMADSIKLLSHILDKDDEAVEMFQFFSASDNVKKLANVATKNRTMAIAETIRRDMSMSLVIEEYLKHDRLIYDFAIRQHEAQMNQLREVPSRGSPP